MLMTRFEFAGTGNWVACLGISTCHLLVLCLVPNPERNKLPNDTRHRHISIDHVILGKYSLVPKQFVLLFFFFHIFFPDLLHSHTKTKIL